MLFRSGRCAFAWFAAPETPEPPPRKPDTEAECSEATRQITIVIDATGRLRLPFAFEGARATSSGDRVCHYYFVTDTQGDQVGQWTTPRLGRSLSKAGTRGGYSLLRSPAVSHEIAPGPFRGIRL